jgi:TolB-like protein/Tfp pilus assembly protein PilF
LLRRTKNPAAEKFISDFKTNQTRDEKAIAVLPFKLLNPNNTGGENEDEFLSIGLADSLITRLSNVKRFIVRPTSSVLPFGKPEVNPFAAGRELGVNYVLDGNIRRAGQRIRVTVQLLNTNDDSTEWAQKFDEDSADVMELEDSISARVADSLLPHLTGDERLKLVKRGTNNAEAYEAYLRGRFFWNRFTADSLPKALEWFQKAIELDPNYALAYVGLADFYTWANIYGILPASQSHPSAERAARKALELDATLGEAYAALALVHSNQWSWAECVRLYEKAIELNPNYPNVHEWYSAYLVSIGETDKGVKEILRAEELDPISLRTMTLVAWTIYQARMFDRTIEKARQIIELDKNYPQGYLQLGNALTEINRHDEAVEAIRKSIEMMPESPLPVYCLCFALARAGRVDEARLVVTELEQTAAIRFVKPYFLAMANAAIGELDNAFKYFEMAADARDPWLLWLGTDAKLDFLRRDPRFIKLFRLMGNPLAFKQPPRPESLFQTTGGGEKSIAVLPLKMLGDFNQKIDTGEEFLGIGLADSLIMRLNQLRSFIVRPTSSVMRFNGSEIEAFEAGRILDVRYVLDGNIRRADRRFRITLQLLDVKNQSTVWAEQFNGDTDDIFRLEDEISEQVAKSLLPQLSSNQQKQLAKRGTDNAKAFDFYMRGRFYWNQFSLEGFSKAFAFYQRAVEIEPNYALAYTGLADYFNFLGVYTVKPFAETAAKAKELSLKALSLDPSLAEAEAALGFSVTMHDFDWAKAEKHFSNAIELNPNYVLGRVWFCYFLGMQKRFDEALVHIEYAMKLDSTTPIVPQTLCWTQFYARRYQEAIAATQQLITREPEYGLSYIFLSQALSTVGRYEEAVSEAEKGVRLLGKSPYTLCWFASVCAAAKLETETHNLLKEIHQFEESRYVSPYMIGMVYSNLRDKERALLQLEKALSIRDGRLMWLGVDPQFDWLRDDSGFQALLRRTGNPTAQKK